jgi:hypothetical protein
MSEDKISVDRQKLLAVLVMVENALAEVKQLKNEIKSKR